MIDEHYSTARTLISRVVALLAPDPTTAVEPNALLREELGYHSLALVELAFVMEDAFALEQITLEEGNAIRTLGDIESYVFSKAVERSYIFVDDDPSSAVAIVDDLDWASEQGSAAL